MIDLPPREDVEQIVAQLERRSRAYGRLRLAAFLLAGLGGLLGVLDLAFLAFVTFPLLLVFPLLVVRHQRVDARVARLEGARTIAQEERERRAGHFAGAPAPSPGRSPITRGHGDRFPLPPCSRLDQAVIDDLTLLDGSHSVFALIDTASSFFGKIRLRALLAHPLRSATDIRKRQAAVAELAERAGERRELLESLLPLRRLPLKRVADALDDPLRFKDRRGLRRMALVLGSIPPLLIVFCFLSLVAVPFLLLAGVINMMIVGLHNRESSVARDHLKRLGPLLRALLALEARLRDLEPRAEEWRDVAHCLTSFGPSAVRLERSVRLLEWHDLGILFEIVNIATLWELRVLPKAEAELDRHRTELEAALMAFGHAEALLSLACLADEQVFAVPEVIDAARPELTAEDLAHPLLPAASRVPNPVALGPAANVVVVTGSNMSGKSTYLKAVGVNLVLAAIGAPVCARSFRFTPVGLFTDVNIRDSLDDGKSYFQVEVERVHRVLTSAHEDPFVLGIFDELFRGTNASERFAISWALLQDLRDSGCLVLVATHDDRLAERVDREGTQGMRNVHFQERVEEQELRFDYTLQTGRAETRNAIRVLEATGYPAAVIDRAKTYFAESRRFSDRQP